MADERRDAVAALGLPGHRRPHHEHAVAHRRSSRRNSETAMPCPASASRAAAACDRARRRPPPATAAARRDGRDQHVPLAAPGLAHRGHRQAGLGRGDPRRGAAGLGHGPDEHAAAGGDPGHEGAGPQQSHVETDLGHVVRVARPGVPGPARTVTEVERSGPDLEDRERDEHAQRAAVDDLEDACGCRPRPGVCATSSAITSAIERDQHVVARVGGDEQHGGPAGEGDGRVAARQAAAHAACRGRSRP